MANKEKRYVIHASINIPGVGPAIIGTYRIQRSAAVRVFLRESAKHDVVCLRDLSAPDGERTLAMSLHCRRYIHGLWAAFTEKDSIVFGSDLAARASGQ